MLVVPYRLPVTGLQNKVLLNPLERITNCMQVYMNRIRIMALAGILAYVLSTVPTAAQPSYIQGHPDKRFVEAYELFGKEKKLVDHRKGRCR